MYIRRKVFSTYIDENGEEKLFSTTEIMSEESYLEKAYSESEPEQKEFNSKDQKRRRRYMDVTVGQKRLNKVNPESAEAAYLWGKAAYPGEIIKSAAKEGENMHIKGELRPGVSREKAAELERRAAKMERVNPEWSAGTRALVAGRDTNLSREGYSKDLKNINQRINARHLGDTSLKEDLKRDFIKSKLKEKSKKVIKKALK